MRGLKLLVLGFLAGVTVLAASPAKAGVLIEPYLGYKLGKYHIDSTVLTASGDWSLSSPQIGARLGYAFPLLFVAADYSTLLGGKLSGGSNGWADGDATESQLFVDVGASLPLIRAYVGYGLTNEFHYKPTNNDFKSEGGTAFKLGIGTTAIMLPNVALNLEYVHSDYDKVGGNSSIKSSSNFYSLNVSFPFDLL